MFLKYTLYKIIGTPRNDYEKNISEVYSHSYSQFWALQGDYEHEIIQPWLPVNWASQISEVALRKELEQWKYPFPPSGQ